MDIRIAEFVVVGDNDYGCGFCPSRKTCELVAIHGRALGPCGGYYDIVLKLMLAGF